MTFDEELRRVVDTLAAHLRHEAANHLQSAMPAVYDAQMAEQKFAVDEGVRKATEDAERATTERLEAFQRDVDRQIAEIEQRAGEQVEQAKREAAEQLEQARREAGEQLGVAMREASEQLETVRREANEALDRVKGEAAAELERVKGELDRVQGDLGGELERVKHEAAEQLESVRREAGEQQEAARRETVERIETLQREAAEHVASIEARAATELDTLRHAHGEQVESLQRELTQRADAVRVEGPEQLERLASAVNVIDAARSLSDVLDALSHGSRSEAASVAVLIARGDRLRSWRLAGFGADLDSAPQFEMALSDAGIIGDALQAKQIVRADSSRRDSLPGFAASTAEGRSLIAIPLIVGAQGVAVVYADAASDAGSGWQAALVVLSTCAARVLEAMTAFRSASQLAAQEK